MEHEKLQSISESYAPTAENIDALLNKLVLTFNSDTGLQYGRLMGTTSGVVDGLLINIDGKEDLSTIIPIESTKSLQPLFYAEYGNWDELYAELNNFIIQLNDYDNGGWLLTYTEGYFARLVLIAAESLRATNSETWRNILAALQLARSKTEGGHRFGPESEKNYKLAQDQLLRINELSTMQLILPIDIEPEDEFRKSLALMRLTDFALRSAPNHFNQTSYRPITKN